MLYIYIYKRICVWYSETAAIDSVYTEIQNAIFVNYIQNLYNVYVISFYPLSIIFYW